MNETNRQLCERYIRKYPDTPNLTLAKLIYEEHPLKFSSVNAARSSIRLVRGSSGKKLKKRATPDLILNRTNIKNPFELPESFVEDWTPYIIPDSVNRLLVLSDIHIPYHDMESLNIALTHGINIGCNGILINGDLIDFYQISRFDKSPNKPTMREEFDAARQFFSSLRKYFPNAHIYFKLGNHEERWERYLMVKSPELFGMNEFRLDVILRLAEYGVHYISDKRIINYGRLNILHGHEFLGATSQAVNPARGLFLKTNESTLIGHLHKTSEHTETTLSGKIITTWSAGCLCYLHPEYARINKWNTGFADIELKSDGNYTVHNKRIYNGFIL